jgi:hypothetical protein
MIPVRYITVLLLCLLILVPDPAGAQIALPESQSVTVWGEASLTQQPAEDHKRALARARRNAVETVIGAYVTSDTLVENNQLVEDRIYSKAAGFINAYEVLAQERKEIQRVKIKADVSVRPLAEILRESGLLRKWRIGVALTPDKARMVDVFQYFNRPQVLEMIRGIEGQIGAELLAAGFKMVDLSQLGNLNYERLASGGPDLAMAHGVDVLVAGAVTLTARTTGHAVYQAVCQIHGKVLRVDTGEIVYQGTVGNTYDGTQLLVPLDLAEKYADSLGNGHLHSGTPDLRAFGGGVAGAMDKAIRLSAAMMGDVMVSQVSRLPAAVSAPIMVETSGLDFDKVSQIEQVLEKIEGVSRVHMEGFTQGVNTLEVEYDGDALTLARSLSGSQQLRQLGLKVKSVTKSKVTLTGP